MLDRLLQAYTCMLCIETSRCKMNVRSGLLEALNSEVHEHNAILFCEKSISNHTKTLGPERAMPFFLTGLSKSVQELFRVLSNPLVCFPLGYKLVRFSDRSRMS